MKVLRILATILGGPILLWGILGVIQGLGILPNVIAPGPVSWAIFGVPQVMVGAALVWWVNRGIQSR